MRDGRDGWRVADHLFPRPLSMLTMRVCAIWRGLARFPSCLERGKIGKSAMFSNVFGVFAL